MSKLVAVTGASGYVAGELISQLIERGYTVRGTVRNLEKARDVQSVFPSLQLFEADLLREGSFDECFTGVEYVFHTASPFLHSWNDPEQDLILPAVNGTRNVLASVERNLHTIKKVVVTSSGAAIVQQVVEDKSKVWSEEDWNTTSTIKDSPYRLSKSLAEKEAWNWYQGKEDRVKLLTVNPCFVLGSPRYRRTDSVSIVSCMNILNGTFKATGR
eukprot:TRINITY_DN688_c0_g1_i5.p1 TRINITY_DN688_c0_g1~~TRINITY_DN688_c0_g1_i5.p1  ORF type:complete len:215 (+),score=35.74 TRINITY_DN688_c0_g1_i5:101-745(+)